MNRCTLCGWLLDDEHAFNIHCPVANAENDQLMAEVAEIEKLPADDQDRALADLSQEIAADFLAYMRFVRDCA